jgi:hypothetical protein
MPKGERAATVEYRDAKRDYTVCLTLRVRPGDPPQVEAGEVDGLKCSRTADTVYQVRFFRSGRKHCHEYPPDAVVRCEEEWPDDRDDDRDD